MDSVDAVVVGAGVVGLAIARALALSGREVMVLEACEAFGTETSSRNSEVIHAGIYYPTGSLKATLCVTGKHLLYRYCEARGVPHQRIGKVLVAVDDSELPALAKYEKQGRINGVPLQPLDAAQVRRLEPEVRAVAGLWSASTGIIDSHALMLALLGDAESAGAMLVTRTPVQGIELTDDGMIVRTGGDQPLALHCRMLVNAAGLHAQSLANRLTRTGSGARPRVPPAYFAKGHYFTLAGRTPFKHLVYPMPDHAGLGIHVTLDLAGRCRFGPDVTGWPQAPEYAFESGLRDKFAQAIRRYWPELPDDALQEGYTGVRPKVSGPTEPAGDFLIEGPAEHGVQGLVNLFGIESPGLTSSLAISWKVADMLGLRRPADLPEGPLGADAACDATSLPAGQAADHARA
jgi:L-2-hydroxyglutarate oxidase LhgO